MNETTDTQPQIYGSDAPSLREAAKELRGPEPEVTEVLAEDDVGTDLTAKEAGAELNKHRQKADQEKHDVEVAMGLHNVEPTEQERLEARLARLEESSTYPLRLRASETQEHYERGQEFQVAQQQAHQVQQYSNQLAAEFNERFLEIQSMEDLQTVAGFDRDRAVEAATYLQQAEAAIVLKKVRKIGGPFHDRYCRAMGKKLPNRIQRLRRMASIKGASDGKQA